ncbi:MULTISPECIES: hypothetical protein [unclassified Spiroplasma]|uniref:hypothetical protein n=1 Tax=unclassified Spiroplasma TaxID=2637901 RepID=UPI0030CCEB70
MKGTIDYKICRWCLHLFSDKRYLHVACEKKFINHIKKILKNKSKRNLKNNV